MIKRSKRPVAINIFSSLDTLELVQLSEENDISVAGSVSYQFDPATREITEPEEFKMAVKSLYESNGITLNTPTNLVLPSYLTREFELPVTADSESEVDPELMLSPEEMEFALISEAEKFHIFKVRNVEPVVSYHQINSAKVIYSAYPLIEIEKIIEVFDELKIPLANIDLNYFSIIRGLLPTGYITEETEQAAPWCLMVITDTTLFLMLLEGLKVVRTAESPLSVSIEDPSATLSEITHDFNAFTGFDSFQKLIVVNNAHHVNSQTLNQQLTVPGVIEIIEQNQNTLVSRGAQEGFPCSLEALGGTVLDQFDGLPFVDFKPKGYEDAAAIVELRQRLMFALGGVAVLCLLLVFLMWGGFFLLKSAKEQEMKTITTETQNISVVATPEKHKDIQQKLFIQRQESNNIAMNDTLVLLGKLASRDTWYTQVLMERPGDIDESSNTKLTVEGNSLMSPDDVDRVLQELARNIERNDLEVGFVTPDVSETGQSFFKWKIDTIEPDKK